VWFLEPEAVQHRRQRSTAWWYWSRTSPRAGIPAGQETMQGSHVPPLNEYRFHILNGVLKAIAQPVG
jgi:hypothetical protein